MIISLFIFFVFQFIYLFIFFIFFFFDTIGVLFMAAIGLEIVTGHPDNCFTLTGSKIKWR